MNFDRYLTQAQLTRDLLVHLACGHQCHHLALARGQRSVTIDDGDRLLLTGALQPVAVDGSGHRVDHVLVAERLWQEIDRTGLHGSDRHRNVAVSRHQDYRQAYSEPDEFLLEVEAI